jgi:hypothetical protein
MKKKKKIAKSTMNRVSSNYYRLYDLEVGALCFPDNEDISVNLFFYFVLMVFSVT